ncbi:hypothetical protein REPUB_Repub02eG0210800 [Reevesia pubescens]
MVTTLFVYNIPSKVRWRWLGRVFQRFGKEVNAFIPRKRSISGSKIGFVRFESLNNARRAQWNLNRVWFLNHKIGVNVARHNPRESFWRNSNGQNGDMENVLQENSSGQQVENSKFNNLVEKETKATLGKMLDDFEVNTIVDELKNKGMGEVLIRKYSGTEWIITAKSLEEFSKLREKN